MSEFKLVTDDELARAHRDPAFRYRLAAANLRMLLDEINRRRAAVADAADSREIREGVELAVELSEFLKRIAPVAAGARAA